MARNSWKRLWIGIGGVAAAGIVLVLVTTLSGRAKVEGARPAERVASVCRIADARPAGAAGAIASAAVGDPDASVRRTAVLCLGKFGRSADRAAVDAASRDADDTVRAAAALTLARRGGEDDVRHLKEMVCTDSSAAVRTAAADSLALHGGPAAIVALLEVMESGPTAEARLAAGEALAQKYGVVTTLDPSDSNLWDNAVESMKLVKSVQEAFQNVNRPSAVRTERLHISEHRCDDPTWSPPGASGSGEAPQSKERATWPSEPSP